VNVLTLLDMAATGMPDRVGIGRLNGRHRHLMSYLLGSVDFSAAGGHEAVIVSVPPYHIAGVSNLLSNVYAGRRVVYLETFTAQSWLDCVRTEAITHALLAPTMLAKITEYLGPTGTADAPTLTSLAYGGAKMPVPVLERAIRLFPDVDFVNAYRLTETSSTIAVLGPDDHRAALRGDPVARSRLGSAGRVLPASRLRSADRMGRCQPVLPATSTSAASRSPASIAAPAVCSTTADGSPPAIAAGSTRTATCSSKGARTTPSSAAARTSRRPRSRTSCWTTPRSPRPPWWGYPTSNGGKTSPRP
jgi:acyl-CoA synthetase (AMP-forming)/AMP-acid ligase II